MTPTGTRKVAAAAMALGLLSVAPANFAQRQPGGAIEGRITQLGTADGVSGALVLLSLDRTPALVTGAAPITQSRAIDQVVTGSDGGFRFRDLPRLLNDYCGVGGRRQAPVGEGEGGGEEQAVELAHGAHRKNLEGLMPILKRGARIRLILVTVLFAATFPVLAQTNSIFGDNRFLSFIKENLAYGDPLYNLLYIGGIIFFCYFCISWISKMRAGNREMWKAR